MTDDEFDKRRKKAVEKDGYKVKIPDLEDIIHLPAEEPMTSDEMAQWKKPGHGNIPADREEELQRMKKKRKDKYDDMLRNPTPDIVRSKASIMCALDDAQDALSTLGVLGRLLLPLLPRAAAGMLSGPVGWALTAAMLLNLMYQMSRMGIPTRTAKRHKNKLSEHNPFTKKGKAGIAKELARKGLHAGNLIEAAQVTDNIWGVGICLGPLMGIPWSVGSGLVRQAMGQKVEWELPHTDWKHWQKAAGRALHSLPALWGDTPFLTDHEIVGVVFTGHFAQQAFPVTDEPCEGLKNIKVVKTLEMCAPTPTNILTREVMQEAGDDPDEFVEWPSTGEKWSNINDLTDTVYPRAQNHIHALYERHQQDLLGYYTGCYAGEAGLYAMENCGGLNSVKTSYTRPSRAVTGLMDMNYKFPDDITEEQINCLAERLENEEKWDPEGIQAGLTQRALDYAREHCGFSFIQAT